jgi:hypothetical protein
MPPKIITISESTRANKKLMATTEQHGKKKVAHFGQRGSDDYTTTKNSTLRDMYIARHNPLSGENWGKSGIMTPGWLARYILWEKKTVPAAVRAASKKYADVKFRFNA